MTQHTNNLMEFCNGEFIAKYFRGRSKDVRRTYRNATQRLWLFLDHEPTFGDLNEEVYKRFKTWLADCGMFKRDTQRSTLQRIRTLWRAAHLAGIAATEPPCPYWHASNLPKVPKATVPTVPRLDALVPVPTVRKKPETPRAFIGVYALERGLEQNSFGQLHYRLNRFEKYLGRPAEYADFNDGEMNLFLHALLQEGLSPVNVKGHRKDLLTLWRSMFEHMYVDQLPLRVRKVKCPAKPPRCWTMPQLVKLVETAGTMRGCFKNYPEIRRANFWRGFVLLKYHTGLRLGDVLALRWIDIAENGMLTITMHKTGDIVNHQLPMEVLAAIGPLKASGKPRVFGDLLNRSHVMEHFRRLVHAAGLKEGTSRWLRRSAATHIEIVSPGAAKAFLGHRTSGLADRNYIDASIVQRQKPQPPRIEGPKGIG